MNPIVNEYFNNLKNWQAELSLLREIALECGLQEEFKWRQACYCYKDSNVFILGGFKEYCIIGFFKGVLLNDSENILSAHGPNSQSSRSIKFTSLTQISTLKKTIKEYIFEALEVEKAGLKVELKQTADYEVPEELTATFNKNKTLKIAFENLTPGRQRGYLLHFSQAKQAKTRYNRIEKYSQRILNGKGINDCVCGLSKKMPTCDGSHKYLKEKPKV